MRSRIADFFSSSRSLWLWSAIGLACFYPVFVPGYLSAGNGYDQAGYMIGRDFLNVWTASKLALTGDILTLFTRETYIAYIRDVYGEGFSVHTFLYPPHMVLFIFFFSLLPYFPSLALWTITGMGAFLVAVRAAARKLPWQTALLLLTSPAAIVNLTAGQNGFFTAALFIGGLALSERRPFLGGALIGALTVKPQLGLLLPPLLLLRRNWKCFAAASATTLVLVGLSLLFWGLYPWEQYPDKLDYGYTLLDKFEGFYTFMLISIYAEARWAGIPTDEANMLYGIVAWGVAAAALAAGKQEGMTARGILIMAIATLAVSPYGYNYDCALITGAIVLFFHSTPKMLPLPGFLLGLLWLLPSAIYELRQYNIPLAPAVMLGTLGWLTWPALRDKIKPAKGTQP